MVAVVLGAQAPAPPTNPVMNAQFIPPTTSSLSPTSGTVGSTVTIAGTNFSTVQATSLVFFHTSVIGTTTATVTSWSNTSITVTVPANAVTGGVFVQVGGFQSNSQTFTVNTVSGNPTLVQSVATGMNQNPANDLQVYLPNQTLSGNAGILGVRFNSAGSISSVVDDAGNTWTPGPTATGTGQNFYNTKIAAYYVTNATPFQKITITFSGLNNNNGTSPQSSTQAVFSEYYNIALSSAIDGTGSSATSRTTSSFSTSGTNDLVWHWAVDLSDTDPNYGTIFNGSSITAGTGFTLHASDLQTGSGAQYQIKAAAGSVAPTFSASGTATWASVALALKSGSGGTAPSATAMRIVHEQHSMIGWGPSQGTAVTMAFPSTGTLLVGAYTASAAVITNITDNRSNSWQRPASALGSQGGVPVIAQIFYAQSASTDPTLGNIQFTLSPSCGNGSVGDCNLVLYDITNGGFFDNGTNTSGNQTTNPGTVSFATLTPANATGIAFHVSAIAFHTITGTTGTGHVSDTMVNSYDDDNPGVGTGTTNGRLDQDNAFSHQAYGTPSAITFSYTYNNRTDSAGVGGWAAAAAAFKQNAGGTFTATDCNRNSVNAVINGPTHTAVNGDTIVIPAGTCTWTAGITVPSNIGITIKGVGTPNTSAATIAPSATCQQTTINVQPVSNAQIFRFAPTQANATSRVSCMAINYVSGPATGVTVQGTCTASGCPNIRWDNLKFTNWTGHNTSISNSFGINGVSNAFGVLDHNEVDGNGSSFLQFLQLGLPSYKGVGAFGDNDWAQAENFGSSEALFVENNTFVSAGVSENETTVVTNGGGRIVVRFNTFSSMDSFNFAVGWHGTESNGRPRSVHTFEAYNNTWTCGAAQTCRSLVSTRNGNGYAWGNSMTWPGGSGLDHLVSYTLYRAEGNPTSAWGACDGSKAYDTNDGTTYFSGSIASASGNTYTISGSPGWSVNQWVSAGSPYSLHDVTQGSGAEITANTANTITVQATGGPGSYVGATSDSMQILRATVCLDQEGRAQGTLYSTNPAESVAASQTLSPARTWMNTLSGITAFSEVGGSSARTIRNRDYYFENHNQVAQTTASAPFNGTTTIGFGHGTKARMPTTCTTGVGYWATDEGSWNSAGANGNLYVCTSTNVWTLSYTPYTYPHPLVQ